MLHLKHKKAEVARWEATENEWSRRLVRRFPLTLPDSAYKTKHFFLFHDCGTSWAVLLYSSSQQHPQPFFLFLSIERQQQLNLSYRAVLLEIARINDPTSLPYSLCNNSTKKNTVQQYSCFETWVLLLQVYTLCTFCCKYSVFFLFLRRHQFWFQRAKRCILSSTLQMNHGISCIEVAKSHYYS